MEDTKMGEPAELLATRRSKRSTAGNRMEAALAEMSLHEANNEQDDDVDFKVEKDEEDVFGSDFESTDEEETAKGGEETGEMVVHEEEKRQRKVARSRLEKATAAAHARNKAFFNPQQQASSSSQPSKPKPKPKLTFRQRLSVNEAVDADDGELDESPCQTMAKKKRKSQRMHTVLNTSATVIRLKESEHKKASAPKKAKMEIKAYTQGELIARALDNEEGNIVEHRDYLKIEEEKRRQARVVRSTIDGPVLRWISKVEEVKVIIPPTPALPPLGSAATPPTPTTTFLQPAAVYPFLNPTILSPSTTTSLNPSQTSSVVAQNPTPTPSYSYYPERAHPAFPSWPPLPPQSITYPQSQTEPASTPPLPHTQNTSSAIPQPIVVLPSSAPAPEPETQTEKVAKNYLVHELARYDGVRKPSWIESMEAMFGDHVKWDEIKVYVGKARPLDLCKCVPSLESKLFTLTHGLELRTETYRRIEYLLNYWTMATYGAPPSDVMLAKPRTEIDGRVIQSD